ncbi:MAG: 2'-5' RNA ligase family protein [Firmicutes bacterium]|nr:2'-5' RNA ligase family protein [Bacillota bacterium]
MKRTIMILPQFDNMDVIEQIRNKYDPLAKLIQPHITLVFPFESEVSNDFLEEVIKKQLMHINPFEVVLQGFSRQIEEKTTYLFLDIIIGAKELQGIHDLLYSVNFATLNEDYTYVPHITVGRFSEVSSLNNAYADVKNLNIIFKSRINKIIIEEIATDEQSIVVKEIFL